MIWKSEPVLSRNMEVDVVALEAGGTKEDLAECKETMMQVVVLNAIIVENHTIWRTIVNGNMI